MSIAAASSTQQHHAVIRRRSRHPLGTSLHARQLSDILGIGDSADDDESSGGGSSGSGSGSSNSGDDEDTTTAADEETTTTSSSTSTSSSSSSTSTTAATTSSSTQEVVTSTSTRPSSSSTSTEASSTSATDASSSLAETTLTESVTSSSASLASPTSDNSDSDDGGPGAGTVVGIVAASLVGLVVIAGLLGYFMRARWGKKRDDDIDDNPFGSATPHGIGDDDEDDDLNHRRRTSTLLSGDDDAQMYDPSRPRPPSMIERHVYAASPAPMLQPGQLINPAAMYGAAGAAGVGAGGGMHSAASSSGGFPQAPPLAYADPNQQSGLQRNYSDAAYSQYYGNAPPRTMTPGHPMHPPPSDYSSTVGGYSLPVTTAPAPYQDPFAEHAPVIPEDVVPSRSGTPLNPNPQQSYHHRFNDSLGAQDEFQRNTPSPGNGTTSPQPLPLPQSIMNDNHEPVAEGYGRSEENAKRTLSVRNGGLDVDNSQQRPLSNVSDAYGGMN